MREHTTRGPTRPRTGTSLVVTERKWTATLNRCEAPGRFGTVVLTDLCGLSELLTADTHVA